MINSYLPVIPGLYGFGTDTRAAYGADNPPEICIVDSLGTAPGNPRWDNYTYPVGVFRGTLIQCLEGVDTLNGETIDGHVVKPNSGKIVLFETSGTIRQTGPDGTYPAFTYIMGSYTTIAGQTSPNPGILLRNIFLYAGDKSDILLQHLRGRMDGPPSLPFGNHKSFTFVNTKNVVVDHISGAWGADAQMEFWYNGNSPLEDFTVSNCLFAEPRRDTGLVGEIPERYKAKAFMIGGQGSSIYPRNGLLYGNVFMSTQYRAPELINCEALAVNNYTYNNQMYSLRGWGESDAALIFSFVGNVVKGGPMSSNNAKNFINQTGYVPWDTPISQHSVYLFDNTCDLGTQLSSSDWRYVNVSPANTTIYADGPDYPNVKVTGENPPTDSPLWVPGLSYMPSSEVKDYVIANAGAYPAFRDSLDLRFISEIANNTGRSRPAQGSPAPEEWPVLDVNEITLDIPAHPHEDSGDGYTNLEKWLHGLAAEVEGKEYDPCEGVVCNNICIGNDLYSQKCDPATGICVTDQLIEMNSSQCGYDPCEGVVCENICIGNDLYSQKCDPATGICVTDQLIERNSSLCIYDLCEGVVCPNICMDNDLWSQKCDPDTGQCVLDELIQQDSIICKIPEQIPADESTIQTYLILGGIGVLALAILMAGKKS